MKRMVYRRGLGPAQLEDAHIQLFRDGHAPPSLDIRADERMPTNVIAVLDQDGRGVAPSLDTGAVRPFSLDPA